MIDMPFRERYPDYRSLPFGWYGVVWSDELDVGAVLPLRYLDRELVAWRDANGTAHVMDAFCRHLGAHLGHGGYVDGDHLVCPFHGWHWRADGTNAFIPYSDRVHSARVHSYPTIERNGIVLCWYHPRDAAPAWEIPEFEECRSDEWGPFERCDWRIATTWQETAENGADFVHLKYVHNTPVLPSVRSYDTSGPINHLLLDVTYYTPKGDVTGTIETFSYGPGVSVARFRIGDFCNLSFIGWCTPIDMERIHDHKAYTVHRDTRSSVGAGFVTDLKRQMEQDIRIFENKRFLAQPALVAGDGPIASFRRWAAQFYCD